MTIPLPFTWPYALLFWPVYVWGFLPEFGVIRRSGNRKDIPAEDRGSLQLILVAVNLALLASFVLAFIATFATLPHRLAWFFAGVGTFIAGSLLRRHCFRVLGQFFTGAVTIQAEHRVIDRGAYRWVRHPSYTAAMILMLGIGLALTNWLSIVVTFVVAFCAYSYRAHVEEQALLTSLGEPYAEFMATRKRFIPFVW